MEPAGICLRCGAPYDADDTVCYSCGAPIGETQSPTQPVRAVRAPKSAPESAPEPDPEPPTPAAPPPASPKLPVWQPPQPSPAAKRRRALWPAIALICVVTLAILGGAAYISHAVHSGPPVANQTLYRDPQHRFQFTHPTLWTPTSTTDGVTMSDSNGASTATIHVVQPAPPLTAASYATQLAQAPEMQPPLASAPQQTIAGAVWEQRTGQVTGQDGAVRQIVLLVTVHDGAAYVIQFSSPISSYSATNTLVYQPLLASFAFDSTTN